MDKIRYDVCRKNLLDFKNRNAERIHSGVMLQDAFYLSHPDYESQAVPEELRQEFFEDIRQCVRVHPKLIYPLLAVMSARYLPASPARFFSVISMPHLKNYRISSRT